MRISSPALQQDLALAAGRDDVRLKASMQIDMNERLVILCGTPTLGAYCACNPLTMVWKCRARLKSWKKGETRGSRMRDRG